MSEIGNTLIEKLKTQFPDFIIKNSEDTETNNITIEAAKTKAIGFDVDISMPEKKARITYSSKIRTYISLGMLLLTTILTYFLGGPILSAIGLVGKLGGNTVTLKLLYVIPMLIFLIPLLIIGSIITKKINPPDIELLNKVKACVAETGFSIDE